MDQYVADAPGPDSLAGGGRDWRDDGDRLVHLVARWGQDVTDRSRSAEFRSFVGISHKRPAAGSHAAPAPWNARDRTGRSHRDTISR